MQLPLTIKRNWKHLAGISCFLGLFAVCIYELYRAWTAGVVGTRTGSVTYDADPSLFTGMVAFFLVSAIGIGALLIGVLWGRRIERRSLQRHTSRPLLDTAVRERFDRNL
ncbi:MAG TPA: hypothetical protein VFB68_11150 [Xanthobacteraceae bacterium]|nr:hypothetical protein [Xanthobacteraceae bacterium]